MGVMLISSSLWPEDQSKELRKRLIPNAFDKKYPDAFGVEYIDFKYKFIKSETIEKCRDAIRKDISKGFNQCNCIFMHIHYFIDDKTIESIIEDKTTAIRKVIIYANGKYY
ncbi:MAG: hypothetical protein FGM54_08475 [Chitinophagaceae bacterium]|nr:hypothetical protein [Chitinophagaceae bacterium]